MRFLGSTLAIVFVLFLAGCAAHQDVQGPETVADQGAGQSEPVPITEPVLADGRVETGLDGWMSDPQGLESAPDETLEFDLDLLAAGDVEEQPVEEEQVDPEELAARALEATEAARVLWEQGDIEEAMRAANAIGDDAIQGRTQGKVVPHSFTHGTSEQRMRWFNNGLESGRIEDGDTFSMPYETL